MTFLVNPYQVQAAVIDSFSNTYSLDFDGADDYVTMGDVLDSVLEYNAAFSISWWMYPTNISGTESLVSKQDVSDQYKGFNVYTNSSKIRASLTNNNGSGNRLIVDGSTTLSNSQWYHIVITYDGSTDASGMKIYVNGAAETMSTVADGLTATTANAADFNIGSRDNGNLPYTGKIDEASIWSAELDSDAVTALYNSGSPIDLSSDSGDYDNSGDLQAWYRMGDGDTYPVVQDETAFSNTSIEFDGVSSYVDCGTGLNSSLGYGDSFSISGWVYNTIAGWAGFCSNFLSGPNGVYITKTNGNCFRFAIVDGAAYKIIDSSSYFANQWLHVTCTYGGSGAMNVYVNASLDNASTLSNGTPIDITSTEIFQIGRLGTTSTYVWDGKIQQVGVWSVELDADAVTALYNSGEPFDITSDSGDYDNSSSLIGFWRMGDGDTYPTITDNSTNSNDGTMTNMASDDFVAGKGAGTMTNMASGDIVEDVPS